MDAPLTTRESDAMEICFWCRTPVQQSPGSYYCEQVGSLFPASYPFMCRRPGLPTAEVNSPKRGIKYFGSGQARPNIKQAQKLI
jgi:hypothetical protein